MELNVIVTSLERSTERVNLMQKQLDKLNSKNVYMYPCFDGKYMTNETFSLKINVKEGYCYTPGKPLNPGDLGCNLSHIGALSMAKALKMDYVIIPPVNPLENKKEKK
jgi:GR25 family glycosyltransferase involved in LPS biosynthesis